MNTDNDTEKYIHYVKEYMKRLENMDDELANQLIESYGLREWLYQDHQAMHYDSQYLAQEIIRTKRAHFR